MSLTNSVGPDESSVENANENESDVPTEPTEPMIPKPRFRVQQTVYARDIETTGILYHAIIRKCQYGPKSKQMNVALHLAEGGKLTDVVNSHVDVDPNNTDDEAQQEDTWHYFIHHFGWKVKWDRWVEEAHVYEDDEKGQRFASCLREAHSNIIKKERKDKAVFAVYRRSKELERQIYGQESVDANTLVKTTTGDDDEQQGRKRAEGRKRTAKQSLDEWLANEKMFRSMALEGPRYSSTKDTIHDLDQDHSIAIPFPLKKILTEEWEVISCGNYHSLPANISVHDVLHAYFASKVQMIAGNTSLDTISNDPIIQDSQENTESNRFPNRYNADELQSLLELHPSLREWNDMMDGLKLVFDQALPRQLLYKQEMAQYLVLKSTNVFAEKAPCEVYGSEYFLRLLLRLPLLIEDGLKRQVLSKEQLGPVFFRLGDLVRFLQRDPERYFALSYRRRNADEIAMEKKLIKNEVVKAEKRLMTASEKEEVEESGEEEKLAVATNDEDIGENRKFETADPEIVGRTRSSKGRFS